MLIDNEKTGQVDVAQQGHPYGARRQRASNEPTPECCAPAGKESRKGKGGGRFKVGAQEESAVPQQYPSSDAGGSQAIDLAPTIRWAPDCQQRPYGRGEGGTHNEAAIPQSDPRARAAGEAVHLQHDSHVNADRFAHPLIAEITETWRSRQDMVRAQQKLTLQAKAICRRFTGGDKAEAEKLWQAMAKDKPHPQAAAATAATIGLRLASKPVEDQRKAYENHLATLAKGLPIAHLVETIRGVNHNTLAAIVGELGDLSAYEKGIAGIWKRAGLAVIDGERQRKKSGDAALLHGYAPSRHAVFWNIGSALLKAQGKDEAAGPYRQVYDERKAYERPRVATDGHAHNRAMRYMTKRLLKHIWQDWKAAAAPPRSRSERTER